MTAKKPVVDLEDFEIALRETNEKGNSDPKLVKRAFEMAKYLGIPLSIKQRKK